MTSANNLDRDNLINLSEECTALEGKVAALEKAFRCLKNEDEDKDGAVDEAMENGSLVSSMEYLAQRMRLLESNFAILEAMKNVETAQMVYREDDSGESRFLIVAPKSDDSRLSGLVMRSVEMMFGRYIQEMESMDKVYSMALSTLADRIVEGKIDNEMIEIMREGDMLFLAMSLGVLE